MQKTEWNILSTRPLSPEVIGKASLHSVSIDCISFIETEAIQKEELATSIRQLQSKPITAVFTSMNAVDAVSVYLKEKPKWQVYCMGHTTKQLVAEAFGTDDIKGTANNASLLADQIIQHGVKEVYFFCGDQRRDELPDKLRTGNIKVNEVTVYHTIHQPQIVDKPYDGILFFSPSAVESFFSINKPKRDTILFAIGNTTADAIRKFSSNTLIIAEQPGKDSLAEEMIAYFSSIQKQQAY
jgi:uroporphyrinogen-III synthase